MKRCTRHKILLAIGTAAAITLTSGFSQITTFTGGNGTSNWNDAANWSSGVPTASSVVEINANPSGGLLEIDNAGPSVIASLRVLSGNVTQNFRIADADTSDSLKVNGNLTNESSSTVAVELPFFAGANATWTGLFNFGVAETKVGTNQITLGSGGIGFTTTGNLTVDIGTGISESGRFLGSFGLTMAAGSNVNIAITGAYTGVDGDVFDFLVTGGFGLATLDLSGATLGGGLTWDTSLFATEGKLSVVPEPNTWALVALALIAFVFMPRRAPAMAVEKKRV